MVFSLDMIGDYISSGATGWVFEHNREPDKVIKVMKAFPRVGRTTLDAFQYDAYLLNRFPDKYNAGHNDYDHDFSTSMLWRPMSAKMMMHMFEETMAYRRNGITLPTGLPKIYDTALIEIPIRDAKDMMKNIESSTNPDGADTFKENFLSIRSRGHRNSYICVLEKLRVPQGYGRSHLRPRVEVFKEVANFLWNDLGLVTRDTANAGNYGFRSNGELVIFDPIVAPLPVSTDWMSTDVFDRLRYNYFSYLFTEEPFPIDDSYEAKPVNRKIKKIEKQLASGTFDTVERSAEDEEVITRSLGQIPDWELRMMYQQGKISKAQMEIGIGLKMEAEFEVEGVNPSLAVYIGPANHLSVAEVINAEHFVLIDSGPEHDYAGGPEQTDRQQDWFMNEIYDMAKALNYSTDYRFRELNKEGAFVIRFTTPKGRTIDYYFNAAHPFSEDIPEIREALLRADSLIISGFFPHKVILDEMPNLETIFLYDQSIYPLTIQEAATEETGRNTLIESLFHRSDLTYTIMSSDEDPDAYEDKAPITDQYIELGSKGTFGSYPEAIAAIAVLKETKHFGVEGFPGSVQDEIQIEDWSVQDLMYSNSITGNFLEDQAKFNYGLNAEMIPKRYHPQPKMPYEVYIRLPSGREKIIYTDYDFEQAFIYMCIMIRTNQVVYEIGIYGQKLKDPHFKDLVVRYKYGEFSGNDPDAVTYAINNCKEGYPKSFEAPAPKQTKVKFPRAKADKIVAKVEKHLKPMVEKMMACGSYRRGAQMIGDIDFVIIPKEGYTLPNMLPPNEGVNWVGENKAQVIIDGEKVDFKVTTPDAWGATILYFTGPAAFNIKYRTMAKNKGKKLNEYGVWDRNTETYLAGKTEQDVFTELGRPYKEPKDRTGWNSKKAEGIRECCECKTQEGVTTIQAGTYCYDCLPINLGAEDRLDYLNYLNDLRTYPELRKLSDEQLLARGIDCVALQMANQESFDAETYPRCPICFEYIPNNQTPGKYPGALARYDNATEICSECGTTEAMVGFMATPEMLVTWQDSEQTFEDYRILILDVKHKMPEVMFGRGPEWDVLQKLNKDNKNSEAINKEVFKKRLGWKVGTQENLDKRKDYTPMAINLSRQNYHVQPEGFEGLGSLFGAEGRSPRPPPWAINQLKRGHMSKKVGLIHRETDRERVERVLDELKMDEVNRKRILGAEPPKDPFKDCGYPQEFLDELAASWVWNPDAYDEETIELAYQTWLQNKREDSFKAAPSADKVFGVQRHDAHRAGLHYDLRLERDGVLKSWSIPKGMPTDKRHLAIETDDHKMSWLDFEGEIKEGYGAGDVKLDSKSTFQTVSYDPKKWVFYVNDGKYQGKYTLVHWKDDKWLISRNHNQSMEAEEKVFNAWYDLATDKQRNYIKRLSGDPHPDLNRRQASKLINQLAREKKALDQIDVVAEEE